MGKYSDLNKSSIKKLEPIIKFWAMGPLNLKADLNSKLMIMTTDAGRFIAGYPLTYAVLFDDNDLVKDLCANGADSNLKDNYHGNKTIFEVAMGYGRAEIVNTLLKHGAKAPNKLTNLNYCSNPTLLLWELKGKIWHGKEVNYSQVKSNILNHKNKNHKL